MRTNVSIELSEYERNLIACKLKGKVRRSYQVSRAEVRELVDGFIKGMIEELEIDEITDNNEVTIAQPDLSRVPAKYRNRPVTWQLGWLRGWDRVKNRRAY